MGQQFRTMNLSEVWKSKQNFDDSCTNLIFIRTNKCFNLILLWERSVKGSTSSCSLLMFQLDISRLCVRSQISLNCLQPLAFRRLKCDKACKRAPRSKVLNFFKRIKENKNQVFMLITILGMFPIKYSRLLGETFSCVCLWTP